MAGPTGIEPATYGLRVGRLGSDCITIRDFSFSAYEDYLKNKYSRSHAKNVFNDSKRFFQCIEDPARILSFPDSKQRKALVAMVALSKYLGCYEEYKIKAKSYGIKWVNNDNAFNGFMNIFSHQHETLPSYIKQVMPLLRDNERLFLKFLALTGLRKNEGLTAFNLVIDLNSKGKLGEYYNSELQVLEHFRFKQLFLRQTKNAYISFISADFIAQICHSQHVSYCAFDNRIKRHKIRIRVKELRSFNNTFLRKNGLLSELVDILSGRVPQSVFCRHYLAEDMKNLSSQVLTIQTKLWETITATQEA